MTEGILDIKFVKETIKYSKGDGIFILSDEDENHIPKLIIEEAE